MSVKETSQKIENITEDEKDLDGELTAICMSSAESSFAEFWENEDDDYWESYLD